MYLKAIERRESLNCLELAMETSIHVCLTPSALLSAPGHAESKMHLSLHQDEPRSFTLIENEARNNVNTAIPEQNA